MGLPTATFQKEARALDVQLLFDGVEEGLDFRLGFGLADAGGVVLHVDGRREVPFDGFDQITEVLGLSGAIELGIEEEVVTTKSWRFS